MPPTETEIIEGHVEQEYKFGFVTDVEQEQFAPGLDEDVIRRLSAKKEEPEWMRAKRLKAFEAISSSARLKLLRVEYVRRRNLADEFVKSLEMICL